MLKVAPRLSDDRVGPFRRSRCHHHGHPAARPARDRPPKKRRSQGWTGEMLAGSGEAAAGECLEPAWREAGCLCLWLVLVELATEPGVEPPAPRLPKPMAASCARPASDMLCAMSAGCGLPSGSATWPGAGGGSCGAKPSPLWPQASRGPAGGMMGDRPLIEYFLAFFSGLGGVRMVSSAASATGAEGESPVVAMTSVSTGESMLKEFGGIHAFKMVGVLAFTSLPRFTGMPATLALTKRRGSRGAALTATACRCSRMAPTMVPTTDPTRTPRSQCTARPRKTVSAVPTQSAHCPDLLLIMWSQMNV
mmetsp:Transcript_5844/g.18749  ORF Transcript_5844/g.18749 Transcript_5844/m.18749 type:complete len:307 (-) Transcript_5844:1183-2103(-)